MSAPIHVSSSPRPTAAPFPTHKNARPLLPAAHYFPPETPPTKPLQFAAAAVYESFSAASWRRDKVGRYRSTKNT
ncbi:hypothetical protein MIMGU_mgv1a017451mg [Erythranthe guttata]|uniref:Uncharacterized protein n=1 Tax=Erythranthe guttata TaxID=4155 RepID=A0A022QB95_ERYGU|nr:hypothetical protein MIMGU_mgv1a017451mg [Erythranthe guttata]